MPIVDVINLNNDKVGSVELSDAVFGAPVNQALLYEAVRNYQANLRRGTAKTKTRHEVAGSGKKLWKQKGTGRARMGSIRSPLWRHGGTTHGPQPRDYSYQLPKKMLQGALRAALTAKLQDGGIKIVNEFALADHKTKTFAGALNKLESPNKILVIDNSASRNLELGARNIPGLVLLASRDVNPYHLLNAKQILISESAAKRLSEGLA
ncbi:MAG TPA: 50S ribosomal protein L4 [Bryobacteraceae bacterium]|nr:50S ribosomal protein L4 [Bryobacteraceae bacterium]